MSAKLAAGGFSWKAEGPVNEQSRDGFARLVGRIASFGR